MSSLFGTEEPTGAHAEPAADGGRDRRKAVLAGVLALAVLGGGAYALLGSGGSSDDLDAISAPVTPTRTGASAKPSVKASAKPAATPTSLPAAATVETGRNPFEALYVEPVVAAPVASAPVVTDGASVASGSTGTGTVVLTSGTSGGTTTSPTTPAANHVLVLKSVKGGDPATGTFDIDGKAYVVGVDKAFGPTSEIMVIAYQQAADGTWTAVLRVGDSAPFDAKQGEKLNVM